MNLILIIVLLIGLNINLVHSDISHLLEEDEYDESIGNENDWLSANSSESSTVNIIDSRTIANVSDSTELIPTVTTLKFDENDPVAIKSKVNELSAVLKNTIHRIRSMFKKLDIVFLIDSSSSVGKLNFHNELKFVVKFLSDFNVSFNYTRVSIVTFSSQGKIVCWSFFITLLLFSFV